jgi:hypothetical protein
MIWRLAHPIRAIIAAWLTMILLAGMIGFGVGVPELVLIVAVGVLVGLLAGGWRSRLLSGN